MTKAIADLYAGHPVAVWLALAAALLILQVAIDARLGETAEYFNAAGVLSAWRETVQHGAPPPVAFIVGQDTLGPLALPVATVVLVAEPLLVSGALILLVRFGGRLVGMGG